MIADKRKFHEAMAQWAAPFARPVVFGRRLEGVDRLEVSSATGTLIQLDGRFIGVTCHHVLRCYRDRKAEGAAEFFNFADVTFEPEAALIDESERLDLVTFDLGEIAGRSQALAYSNFLQPARWPPGEITEDDVITFLGFPGVWREQVSRSHFNFYHLGHGASSVDSISDEHICSRIMFDESTHVTDNKRDLASAGGMSGAPVFVWRTGAILTAELIGFIYEHQPDLDLLYIRRAKCLDRTGELLK